MSNPNFSKPLAGDALLQRLLAFAGSNASPDELLRRFPSLGHVVFVDPAELETFGVGARAAELFRLLRDTAACLARAEVASRPVIRGSKALIDIA